MVLFAYNLVSRFNCLMGDLSKFLYYWIIKACLKIQDDFCPNEDSNFIKINEIVHHNAVIPCLKYRSASQFGSKTNYFKQLNTTSKLHIYRFKLHSLLLFSIL